MVHCCVIGCNSRSERKIENITFHSFPKDTVLRDSWIKSTGRRNWTPGKNTRICSKHFNANCFRRTQRMTFINTSSVPTLFIHRFPICSESDGNLKVEVSSTCATTDPVMEHDTYTNEPSTSSKSIVIQFPTCSSGNQKGEIPSASSTKNPVVEDDSCSNKPSTSTKIIMKHHTKEDVTTPTMTPRKKKLVKKLNRQIFLAESRKKKLAVVRSKCRRLEKKNAELSVIIKNLQSKNLIHQEAADLLLSIDPQKTDFLKTNKRKSSRIRNK